MDRFHALPQMGIIACKNKYLFLKNRYSLWLYIHVLLFLRLSKKIGTTHFVVVVIRDRPCYIQLQRRHRSCIDYENRDCCRLSYMYSYRYLNVFLDSSGAWILSGQRSWGIPRHALP